jgi:hypothetical protein
LSLPFVFFSIPPVTVSHLVHLSSLLSLHFTLFAFSPSCHYLFSNLAFLPPITTFHLVIFFACHIVRLFSLLALPFVYFASPPVTPFHLVCYLSLLSLCFTLFAFSPSWQYLSPSILFFFPPSDLSSCPTLITPVTLFLFFAFPLPCHYFHLVPLFSSPTCYIKRPPKTSPPTSPPPTRLWLRYCLTRTVKKKLLLFQIFMSDAIVSFHIRKLVCLCHNFLFIMYRNLGLKELPTSFSTVCV